MFAVASPSAVEQVTDPSREVVVAPHRRAQTMMVERELEKRIGILGWVGEALLAKTTVQRLGIANLAYPVHQSSGIESHLQVHPSSGDRTDSCSELEREWGTSEGYSPEVVSSYVVAQMPYLHPVTVNAPSLGRQEALLAEDAVRKELEQNELAEPRLPEAETLTYVCRFSVESDSSNDRSR